MEELTVQKSAPEVRTLETIGAEIRAHAITMEYHMRGTVYEAIEIGRRLVEARDVAKHGEWMAFLERETPFSHDKANNLIKVFEGYGDQQKSLFGTELSNSDTYRNLSYSQALVLLALPSGEREEFVETHNVEDMTTKELKQAIRERDEARAALQQTTARLEDTQRTLAESGDQNRELQQKLAKAQADVKAADNEATENERRLKERIKELESRPIDVAVQVDETAVQKAADEARKAAEAEWSARVKVAEDKLAKAEEKAKKAVEQAKTAGADASKEAAAELDEARQAKANAEAEAEQLRAELETAKREQTKASISGDADLAAFQLLFEAAQENVNKMRGLLLKVRGREDSDLGEKLAKALNALGDAVKEAAK